jgi:hypothetical protein
MSDYTSDMSDRFLKANRWQHIVSGVIEPRFQKILSGMLNAPQAARIEQALEPLTSPVPSAPKLASPMAA